MTAAETGRIQVSKLDAAKRQLSTSIRLWFFDDDPVSAHTLAYAAYTVIDDVTKARNPERQGLLFDSEHLTPEDRELFRKVYRGSGNFFKHADRDHNDTLDFSPSLTRIFFNFALCALNAEDDVVPSDEMLVFQAWSIFHYPHLRSEKGSTVFTDSFLAEYGPAVLKMSKSEFFDFFTEVMATMRTIKSQRHSNSPVPTVSAEP